MRELSFTKEDKTKLIISLKLPRDVSNIGQLRSVIEALDTVEYLYRIFLSGELKKDSPLPVDFRRAPYKYAKRAHLSRFCVESPPEIEIDGDSLWLLAIVYVLQNYKTVKGNVFEILTDIDGITKIIHGISSNELEKLKVSITMYSEDIKKLGFEAMRLLSYRIARSNDDLHKGDIKQIKIDLRRDSESGGIKKH